MPTSCLISVPKRQFSLRLSNTAAAQAHPDQPQAGGALFWIQQASPRKSSAILHPLGPVAQLVEQRIENPRVGGSIPPQATISTP